MPYNAAFSFDQRPRSTFVPPVFYLEAISPFRAATLKSIWFSNLAKCIMHGINRIKGGFDLKMTAESWENLSDDDSTQSERSFLDTREKKLWTKLIS